MLISEQYICIFPFSLSCFNLLLGGAQNNLRIPPPTEILPIMLLMLDGNSEKDAHVLISAAVSNLKWFLENTLFSSHVCTVFLLPSYISTVQGMLILREIVLAVLLILVVNAH